jgi:arsenate reductase (thioredoxin)
MEFQSILFVGQRNAARSIMAETCFNSAAIIGWRAFSAGWQTQLSIDPMTLRVLAVQGFPTDSLSSKPVDIFRQTGAPKIDLCIFLDERLPTDAGLYPGQKEYWRIANPCGAGHELRAYQDALRLVTVRISDLFLSGRLWQFQRPFRQTG